MADTLGFMIGDVSRLLRRAFDVRARAIGVTRPQWKMLLTLSRHEGVNQGRLADLLDVEAITLCRMVDRLEESGMVERRPDPADRRAWRIYLTDKAHPILDELRLLGNALSEDALTGLTGPDRDALENMLERIRTNLNDLERKEKVAAHG
ncbi:MarR family winged helix-turn-helix transcriptional regulator [Sphingomonas tabacisoli]|uniref:MarR family winged helix-turn-helix transcriptional regulator n=1 Tax=Sphingomonas tabacisoli TaxID=2249466 RepID=A0ABW4I3M5_9SPHN